MKYLKMTNGPVRVLVAEEDKAQIQDRLKNKFVIMKNKNGYPVFVDSRDIAGSSEDLELRDIIYGIK
jgi:hypothetical protein